MLYYSQINQTIKAYNKAKGKFMSNIYLGMAGQIICLDRNSGDEIWRTKLKSSSSLTNLIQNHDRIIAYAGGHIFCLDANSGDILWENELKGLGYGYCMIAGAQQSSGDAQAQAHQTAAVAGLAATGIIASS